MGSVTHNSLPLRCQSPENSPIMLFFSTIVGLTSLTSVVFTKNNPYGFERPLSIVYKSPCSGCIMLDCRERWIRQLGDSLELFRGRLKHQGSELGMVLTAFRQTMRSKPI